MTEKKSANGHAAIGIAGLDDILGAGLLRERCYLLEGSPGTGKTTIAMQFLLAGAAAKEKCLYITLSETEAELRATASAHRWDLKGIDVFELAPPEDLLDEDQQQSLLYSSDLELGETTKRMFDAFTSYDPNRVVIDSLSEIRLLAQSSLRYRRQILAIKHFFAKHKATVLMLDDMTSDTHDKTVHSVAHGVIRLEQRTPEYGAERRRLRIVKYRGTRYRGGYHDFVIETGGVRAFPRLISAEHRLNFQRELLTSESAPLNSLLGGGVERGSSVLLLGPAGSGKSILALTFLGSAAKRGEKSAMFVFDEELGLLMDRSKGLGLDLENLSRGGKLKLLQVDAAELTPGEFSAKVREQIEAGCKTIVIDSLNGYQASMPEEKALILHMHEILQYCNRQGATTFLTVAHHGLVGEMKAPVDLTYLADTVVLLRYFETLGRVRRAMSVVKKRTSAHEHTIREYRLDSNGVTLGEPLVHMQGVLTGVPTLFGDPPELLELS